MNDMLYPLFVVFSVALCFLLVLFILWCIKSSLELALSIKDSIRDLRKLNVKENKDKHSKENKTGNEN